MMNMLPKSSWVKIPALGPSDDERIARDFEENIVVVPMPAVTVI